MSPAPKPTSCFHWLPSWPPPVSAGPWPGAPECGPVPLPSAGSGGSAWPPPLWPVCAHTNRGGRREAGGDPPRSQMERKAGQWEGGTTKKEGGREREAGGWPLTDLTCTAPASGRTVTEALGLVGLLLQQHLHLALHHLQGAGCGGGHSWAAHGVVGLLWAGAGARAGQGRYGGALPQGFPCGYSPVYF